MLLLSGFELRGEEAKGTLWPFIKSAVSNAEKHMYSFCLALRETTGSSEKVNEASTSTATNKKASPRTMLYKKP
jgi:hypothetical protein